MNTHEALLGRRCLLAGTIDTTLVGVGAALVAAGAEVMAAESPLWGDLVTEAVQLEADDPAALATDLRAIEPPDVLVIQAGWRERGRFLDSTPQDWAAALTQNFEAPVYLSQAVARRMIEAGKGGRIIFLSSVEGVMPFEEMGTAGTTLTMLTAMARMMAVDLARYGITVNVVTVGWMDSGRLANFGAATQQHILEGIPAGQAGTPADVGAAVCFLASAAAGYVTGVNMTVDGGYLLTRAGGRTMFEGG